MAGLASNLEGDIVGGVGLDLDGAGREVVEVLVEELYCAQRSQWLAIRYSACMGCQCSIMKHSGGWTMTMVLHGYLGVDDARLLSREWDV